jgi:hypothetical protein
MTVLLLAGTAFADDAPQNLGDAPAGLQGLWAGSWGGGQRDGVVFQPVLAEMVVHEGKIEISGFRTAPRSLRKNGLCRRQWSSSLSCNRIG